MLCLDYKQSRNQGLALLGGMALPWAIVQLVERVLIDWG